MAIPDDSERLNPTRFDPDFAAPPQWAAMYRAAGFQVVPCKDKRPALHEWKEFQNELIAQTLFEVWYGPGGKFQALGNMGVITGPCSGNLFIIDLDHQKNLGSEAWWLSVINEGNSGLEPETCEQQTGGGGRQKLFRAPDGFYVPTIRTNIGVDIRGTGGFAVLPPTLHQSGKNYGWLPLAGPWQRAVEVAEPWLLDAVCSLAEAHSASPASTARTASPGNDYTAFGLRQDGREDEMFRKLWRAVLELYRACPIQPPDAAAMEAYEAYELGTSSRIAGVPRREGLEREGRGPTAWMKKWRREMRLWGSPKMVREAARPAPEPAPEPSAAPPEPPKIDPATGQPLPLVLTAKQFLAGYVPPNYLIDGIVQQHYLYALTARTGHGKTAIAMLAGTAVARGVPFHGRETVQGNVLFLAGENSQDVRVRYKVLATYEGFDPETTPMYFIDGVIDIATSMPRIEAEVAKIGSIAMVIVDTAAAYFKGDDANSNAQQGQFAQVLRRLIQLPGNPLVLANCHPVKNATQDNLIPLGGSHFLNEIDGNLTLWTEDRTCRLAPHQDKWRGANFEALDFELLLQFSDTVRDAKGRNMPSVVAVPITEMGAQRKADVAEEEENTVMRLIHTHKHASFSEIAKNAGFVLSNGQPYKSKVQRIVDRLKQIKMVYRHRGSRYRLTKKGCTAAGMTWESENDSD